MEKNLCNKTHASLQSLHCTLYYVYFLSFSEVWQSLYLKEVHVSGHCRWPHYKIISVTHTGYQYHISVWSRRCCRLKMVKWDSKWQVLSAERNLQVTSLMGRSEKSHYFPRVRQEICTTASNWIFVFYVLLLSFALLLYWQRQRRNNSSVLDFLGS